MVLGEVNDDNQGRLTKVDLSFSVPVSNYSSGSGV